jgi:hypothetical protein
MSASENDMSVTGSGILADTSTWLGNSYLGIRGPSQTQSSEYLRRCLQFPGADSGTSDRALQAISEMYLSIFTQNARINSRSVERTVLPSLIYAQLLYFKKISKPINPPLELASVLVPSTNETGPSSRPKAHSMQMEAMTATSRQSPATKHRDPAGRFVRLPPLSQRYPRTPSLVIDEPQSSRRETQSEAGSVSTCLL